MSFCHSVSTMPHNCTTTDTSNTENDGQTITKSGETSTEASNNGNDGEKILKIIDPV